MSLLLLFISIYWGFKPNPQFRFFNIFSPSLVYVHLMWPQEENMESFEKQFYPK